MRTNKDLRKKKFLALCLSALMVSSAMAGFAACGDDDSSDSSSSSTVTESTPADKSTVKNGGFETFSNSVFDNEDNSNVIATSASNWTRSVNSTTSGSALSSKAASGIVDVTLENWNALTKSNLGDTKVSDLTVENAEAKWADMSIKDKLDFYADYEDRDDDNEAEDLDFYKSYNIDNEDVPVDSNGDPLANPLTHDYKQGEKQTNTKVLMIHNEYANSTYTNLGTAQKYTSSSTVTVKAGTSAQFSVWVKTSDLQTAVKDGEDEKPAVGKGAYISITHSVGGKSLDPLEVKNIDTSNVPVDADNNWGWVQYEFLLKGSSFADTTFTIVLGLGQGGGTDRYEYVNGYAFFDDVTCETISNADYETECTSDYAELGFEESKSFDAYNLTGKKYALNYYSYSKDGEEDTIESANGIVTNATTAYTTEKNKSNVVYTSVKNPTDGSVTYSGLGFDTTNDVQGAYATPAAITTDAKYATNTYLQAVYADHFKDNKLFSNVLAADNQNTLVLLSADGAAMKATTDKTFKLEKDHYMMISFFLKTSDMNGVTGAGVTVVEKATNTKTSLSSLDTTDITTVDINDENKDIYGGWQQCFLFIANETDVDEIEFTLEFNLGPTAIVGSSASSYRAGFAAFTGFQIIEDMSEQAYECATSGTYTSIVSLTGEKSSTVSDTGFDSAASTPTDAIEEGFADPKNYRGVYSDSAYLGKDGDANINENENAGLLNKDYADTDAYKTILNKLEANATWDTFLGTDSKQPLIIYNPEESTRSYGFLGKSTSISANTYKTISLRVKASVTNAYVYLIDMDSDNELLSIGRNRTYWYDAKGNVCVEDPTENTKNKNIAFKLQSNGLYKMNEAWAQENNVAYDENAYFANLAAYEEVDGNLLVAEDGVSYDYNDNWRNDGNDGIAFYGYDKTANTAYADSAKKVLVSDFSTVFTSYRYEAMSEKTMMFEVEANGQWANVSFNVHTGDTAKNYRLEVWSGSRDGETVAAGSYAIFDSYPVGDIAEEDFTTLTDSYKDSLTEGEDYFEGVFSFYDTAKFLRYDESLDENDVNNSYTSYNSTSYTSGLAYMKYVSGQEYEIYADYAKSEVAVTADVTEDDSDDSEDTDNSTESDTNVALLISSIAVAAILVFAMASLAVRKIVAYSRKKRGSSAYAKAAAPKAKKEKPVKKTVKEDKDEDSPYND